MGVRRHAGDVSHGDEGLRYLVFQLLDGLVDFVPVVSFIFHMVPPADEATVDLPHPSGAQSPP